MTSLREKLWNIDLIIDDIKELPQTYDTILGDSKNDGTFQVILRRKLNKSFKYGLVCKTTIPGTRFGKVLLYAPSPKKYSIIIESSRVGSKIYTYFESEDLGEFYILLKDYYELVRDKWVQKKNKKIFKGNVLKVL